MITIVLTQSTEFFCTIPVFPVQTIPPVLIIFDTATHFDSHSGVW